MEAEHPAATTKLAVNNPTVFRQCFTSVEATRGSGGRPLQFDHEEGGCYWHLRGDLRCVRVCDVQPNIISGHHHLGPPRLEDPHLGNAKISVPSDWVVHGARHCVNRSASGTLQLGSPKFLSKCQVVDRDANTVTLTPIPTGGIARPSVCPPMKMNGLQVIVGPCGSSDSAGLVSYVIPVLGVEATGTGTFTENVTGPGEGTIVGRVLHTLRKG